MEYKTVSKRRIELAQRVIGCQMHQYGVRTCVRGGECYCATFRMVTQHFQDGENELVDLLRNTFTDLKPTK